jgi:hypothetical protein
MRTIASAEDAQRIIDKETQAPQGTRIPWTTERLANGRVSKIPPGYVTIAMMMERTGFSRKEINSLTQRKIIKPSTRNNQGWMLYLESCVDTVVKYKAQEPQPKERALKMMPASNRHNAQVTAYSTDEALTVYELSTKGLRPGQISFQAKLHPSIVRTILRDYEILDSSIVLSPEIIDQINQLSLPVEMPMQTPADILKALKVASNEHTCTCCKKRPCADVCSRCAKAMILNSIARRPTQEDLASSTSEESADIIEETG